ncbi:hypothetical protein WEN_00655 [Mycoplasma wenyonii str. Massachusetts]|uniref:Uncharacterized protein n=1 Tax=Mycoplasma wenyonii (strain Massachusetts) TaxID=1197325 RepID=I6YAG3_MYCWM|nr:hypothetical protein [Mycoplasma wenyonii]AFN64936.1 hypothetical protein WEN_00655 [Mycoplasma wenyonii str. Massachusetts]
MISLVKRTLQIFAGLSVGSTIPFMSSISGRTEEIKLPRGDDRTVSNDKQEETQEVKEVTENVMLSATKRMEESGKTGEKGCFWLFEERRWLELFICVDMKTLGSPTLFHYARRERNLSQKEKLNEVSEITYNGTSTLKMTFSNNRTIEMPRYLSLSFAWLRQWGTGLFFQNHCNISKDRDTKTHTLTCDNLKKSGGREFTKKVNPELPHNSN